MKDSSTIEIHIIVLNSTNMAFLAGTKEKIKGLQMKIKEKGEGKRRDGSERGN